MVNGGMIAYIHTNVRRQPKLHTTHPGSRAETGSPGATVLILLSVMPVMAYAAPEIAFYGVHPISPAMIATVNPSESGRRPSSCPLPSPTGFVIYWPIPEGHRMFDPERMKT